MTPGWTKHSTRETYAAQTPIGLVTVALRPVAGRAKQWVALDVQGRRIACSPDADECMESAMFQASRLAMEGPSR